MAHQEGNAVQRVGAARRQSGQEDRSRIIGHADHETPAVRLGVEGLLPPQQTSQFSERGRDPRCQGQSLVRRLHATAAAHEQRVVPDASQSVERMTDRRLRHPEPQRRSADARLLHQRVEDQQGGGIERP